MRSPTKDDHSSKEDGMPKYEFTMVSDPMLMGLWEAGATATEIIAYIMLVRGLPKDRKRTDCWMPADMAPKKAGMSEHTFSKAVRALTRKTVTLNNGERVAVLTQTERGRRGHSAHFNDNLGQAIREGLYPLELGTQQGTQW